MNKSDLKKTKKKISAKALQQFADNRRIFNKAVEKAIEENKKAKILTENLYAK